MKKNNSKDSSDQENNIYRLLPQARPLHNKSIVQPKSAFQFVAEGAPSKQYSQMQITEQLMQNVEQDRNTTVHFIGNSLAEIFKYPIYQSYDNLVLGDDNSRFATCKVNLEEGETLKPAEIKCVNQQQLLFQSRFQCGNLAVASRSDSNPNQYFLALQRDTNSHATCQWYYFYVDNLNNTGQFKFNIVNFVKSYSAYQNGMKPCVLSMQSGEGWKRDGYSISYRKSSIMYRGERPYYTLQFSYNFVNKNDRTYFAYSYPYSFSRLQNFINEIQSNHSSLAQIKVLAKTLKDNPVNIISVTNPYTHDELEKKKGKKDMIMVCARVHPGQTNSSFACQSFVKFLLGPSEQANNLRTHYIIKIIPFLNPDGVIHGNYRTSLSGHDLNRRWKRPDKDLHPQIQSVKKYLNQSSYNKALFIDLHGHSKKRSSFMYGCLNRQNPYLCKQFPFILSKTGHHFCYFNCNFSTPPSREGTSRLNVWKQFKVDYSYTMEISFCGPVRSRQLFNIKDYFQIGASLGKVMSVYFCGKKSMGSERTKLIQILDQFYSEKKLLDLGNNDSQGSESGEQELVVCEVDKKEQKNTFSNREGSKDLSGILTRYLNDSKMKWNKRETIRPKIVSRKQEQSEPNLRGRKQLAPSRISIQKIDLSEQINNPYLGMGFIRGSIRLTSRELKGMNNKQLVKGSSNRKSYGPYSSNKVKMGKTHAFNDQSTLMLPKVLRQQEIKYRKYRRNQCNFQISLNNQDSRAKLSPRASHHTSRQISLAQKIFQSTHRQLQQAGRYWVRNS